MENSTGVEKTKKTGLHGCETCKQSGKIVGLGNFKIKCPACSGIGWKEKISEKEEDDVLRGTYVDLIPASVTEPVDTITAPKKRMGRPPKKVA